MAVIEGVEVGGSSSGHTERPRAFTAPASGPEQGFPQVILDDTSSTASGRWRARRAATAIPLLLMAVANMLQLGVVDHLWAVAGCMSVAMVAALPVLMWTLGRRDKAAMASGPPGTLFTSRFSIAVRQLNQPRFRTAQSALLRAARVTGFLSGRMLIVNDDMHLITSDPLPADFAHIAVRSLSVIELTKLPAKVNTAGIDLTFTDGSLLSIEVGQYDKLRVALPAWGHSAAS
ncbi:MAG: hypothetical protein ACREOQ_13870 [Gemmatimonadales bacterium]